MTTTTDTAASLEQDLEKRRGLIRRTEILLMAEQWGPVLQQVADDWVRNLGDLVQATEEEKEWLRELATSGGMAPQADRSPEQWSALRREQARAANAAASTAFLTGQYDTARDLIDKARAHGGLMATEWSQLHQFIVTRAAQSAGGPDPQG